MNCWIILLLLLCNNQNGREGIGESDCGGRPIEPRDRDRDRDCDRDRDRDRGRERDAERDNCPCNNESRFEPRFDARPFNNSGCGCDDN